MKNLKAKKEGIIRNKIQQTTSHTKNKVSLESFEDGVHWGRL